MMPKSMVALGTWSIAGVGRAVGVAVLGSAALAISAKVQVPFWPVPMTMQSLVAVMLGVGFGWRLGVGAVVAYLLEGALGLPVFAGALAGPVYMAGPTGGYLAGFVLAAAGVGWLAERGWSRGLGRTFALMLVGHALIFVPGVAWLATSIGAGRAVLLGLVPFVVGTLVKSALGAGLVLGARGR